MEVQSPPVRFVEVRFGDDLRVLALRELGTAERWIELANLNGLRHPYIADVAADGVLAYGDLIQVPAAVSEVSADLDAAGVFEIDLQVLNGNLSIADGDFVVVEGLSNLVQALRNHIIVDKRELAFHPEFGCYVRSVLGLKNGPTSGQLAAFYVKSALLEDPRIQEVQSCIAEVSGDQILVTATVNPISGRPVDMTVVV